MIMAVRLACNYCCQYIGLSIVVMRESGTATVVMESEGDVLLFPCGIKL